MSDVVRNGHVSGLLFLHAQTAIHPGSGTALGVVDLPVQREAPHPMAGHPRIFAQGRFARLLPRTCQGHYQDDADEPPHGSRQRTRRQKANEDDPDLVDRLWAG